MTKFILDIYDFLLRHKRLCLGLFLVITVLLGLLVMRLEFKEDISAFLPLDERQQESLSVYQDVSGASKILGIVQYNDKSTDEPDSLINAIVDFQDILTSVDSLGMVKNLVTEFDLEKLTDVSDFVYYNIPYFLQREDYARLDSMLAEPGFVSRQLENDKQLLMFPTSGLLSANLQKDPLNLFSPIVSQLKRSGGESMEMYDGYIFTSDMSKAIVMMESPYGNSETQNNAKLMEMLQSVADSVNSIHPSISLHYIGGPAIAVGNASQIRNDSVLSVAIAVVLIVLLLVVVFRRFWNILLIVISVAWGWLFAMAILAIIHDSVSLIVIGISSIILGIAVNYPLHLIAHTNHTQSMRQVLREIITPLVIGNITTVGAFIALVPLQATALRDLGIFSAFILIGTIIFVVIFLPHAVKIRGNKIHEVKFLTWLSNISLENSRWLVIVVCVLTCVFAYYSTETRFDANMSHINYMTAEQHADMEYFKAMTSGETDSLQTIYIVTSGQSIDDALDARIAADKSLTSVLSKYEYKFIASPEKFLPSQKEQQSRLEDWRNFVGKHKTTFDEEIPKAASELGFQSDAFDEFKDILTRDYQPQSLSYFEPLDNINSGCISIDKINGKYRVVDAIVVNTKDIENIKAEINNIGGGIFSFDVAGMNSSLARGLSDNFNYIGWACGLIVFFFLWFSFASLELALISFLPMAVSWIWIMGIMGITDIQFNIVNIILATFIFGQGDDYTIFMTEGCCYEFAYRKKMLASYKSSIIVSALIMFIGIGTLIFAKHPALHSLAEVTIVGMFSVVLMAYLLPPLVFKWITRSHGHIRRRPLTLGPVLRTWFCGAWWLSQLLCGYILGFFLFVIGKRTPKTERIFHRFVTWSHRIDIRLLPGVRVKMHNSNHETLDKPCVIVCNHQSLLDPMFFMAWSPKIIIVANERSSLNPVVRIMFKWLGFYTIRQSNFTAWKDSTLERDMAKFKQYVEQGYSIAFFPEGVRNPKSTVLRCHKGPFYLAHELGLDVLPVLLHGVNHLMPIGSFACYKGEINMTIGKRITPYSPLYGNTYKGMTQLVHRALIKDYNEECRKYETAQYFASLVLDRYRYKGTELMLTVKRNLKRNNNYSSVVDKDQPHAIIIANCGYGEAALLMALVHRNAQVFAFDEDPEKIEVAKYAAEGIAMNLTYLDDRDQMDTITNSIIYDLQVAQD